MDLLELLHKGGMDEVTWTSYGRLWSAGRGRTPWMQGIGVIEDQRC